MSKLVLIRSRADGDLEVLTGARRRITISPAALATAEAVGLDLDTEIDAMISRLTLLGIRDEESRAAELDQYIAQCLDGAEPADTRDWRAYAAVVMAAASGPDDREP